MKRVAVIKVRSNIGVPKAVRDTMKMLNLTRVNHCVVIDDRKSYKNMLQKAKDYITWGEITEDTFYKMLEKRGRAKGNKRIDDKYIKEHSKFKTMKEFVKAFMNFEAEINDVDGLKKVFRLSPPRGGYKSIKKSFANRGALGYRGSKINELIEKMI
ncbi:MAG: 50S ribosomal protein L30 [Candidatus Diapherotrites archaeon]|nr:50S ribosomal protein L30 [Candidatus Diapherotrites archaeon]